MQNCTTNTTEILGLLNKETEDFFITKDCKRAFLILGDGTMIDGYKGDLGDDFSIRVHEHNECQLILGYDRRVGPKFWTALADMEIFAIMPEQKSVFVPKGYEMNLIQSEILKNFIIVC